MLTYSYCNVKDPAHEHGKYVTVPFVHSSLCTETANSGFAHVCLGFILQKQRENTSRRQRVNSNKNIT